MTTSVAFQSLPTDYAKLVELKLRAGEGWVSNSFGTSIIPGILQIESYARLVISPGYSGVILDHRIRLRLELQQSLHRGMKHTILLAEGMLHQRLGGPEVMNPQLLHLLDVTDLPGVEILVIPFGAQKYHGLYDSFEAIRSPEGTHLYRDDITGGRLDTDPSLFERYLDRFTHACAEVSLDAAGSRALIEEIAVSLSA